MKQAVRQSNVANQNEERLHSRMRHGLFIRTFNQEIKRILVSEWKLGLNACINASNMHENFLAKKKTM